MKNRFYLSALLSTMLLSSAYASWVPVPLTDTNPFNTSTCDYRFNSSAYAGFFYATYIDSFTIVSPHISPGTTWKIDSSDKTIAYTGTGGQIPVARLQMRCD